jgi:dCMP deaminase
MAKKVMPREVPDRDSKYMGLAWIHAGFSKDPSTQVGAQVVGEYNNPLGSGYNGPPRLVDDTSFSWDRPPKDDPEAFSKYDIIVHAEINAMDHSCGDLTNATLYVTAFPCPDCMLEIVRRELRRVVYYDFRSGKKSSLQDTKGREKSLKIANMANIRVEEFTGNVNWVPDWAERLRELGVFE